MSSIVSVGEKAPDFALNDGNGNEWRLADQAGSVTVLLFYPQNETLVCTKQLCSVRDNWNAYLETKAVIVGISPPAKESHVDFGYRHGLPLPLLIDDQRAVTRQFAKHAFFPISFTRAVVVVDAKGIVRSKEVMLRAFRPKDETVITSIYAARGDAISDRYEKLRSRAKRDLNS